MGPVDDTSRVMPGSDALAVTFADLASRIDIVLIGSLSERRQQLSEIEPRAAMLVDEVTRLVRAGGSRLRPMLCYWGYRASGGSDEPPILRAAAALELLHTFALIHDDLMDGALERRGVASSEVHLEGLGEGPGERRFGLSAAILAGDLSAVLADELLLESGFGPETLVRSLACYNRMRTEMAAGQLLDLLGEVPRDEEELRRTARLKGGAYSVQGPLEIGAALAGASEEVTSVLARYGEPLGEAFQLRDDLLDASQDIRPTKATAEMVDELIERAISALDASVLGREPCDALAAIAREMLL